MPNLFCWSKKNKGGKGGDGGKKQKFDPKRFDIVPDAMCSFDDHFPNFPAEHRNLLKPEYQEKYFPTTKKRPEESIRPVTPAPIYPAPPKKAAKMVRSKTGSGDSGVEEEREEENSNTPNDTITRVRSAESAVRSNNTSWRNQPQPKGISVPSEPSMGPPENSGVTAPSTNEGDYENLDQISTEPSKRHRKTARTSPDEGEYENLENLAIAEGTHPASSAPPAKHAPPKPAIVRSSQPVKKRQPKPAIVPKPATVTHDSSGSSGSGSSGEGETERENRENAIAKTRTTQSDVRSSSKSRKQHQSNLVTAAPGRFPSAKMTLTMPRSENGGGRGATVTAHEGQYENIEIPHREREKSKRQEKSARTANEDSDYENIENVKSKKY